MKLTLSLTLLFATAALGDFETKCKPPADRGPCSARIPLWAFNATRNRCQRFYYGGCDGNENKHYTRNQCELTCLQSDASRDGARPQELREFSNDILPVPDVPNLMWSVLTNPACLLPPDRGMCSGYDHRFFYEAGLRTCQGFVYGGCGGNANNFASLDQCYEACSPRQRLLPRT
ncbi:kunitz-type serine protease inhibitor 6-like [Dermacentor silvarum]|uniref:kunitz-type serine protease inhibitor 6-like n=1 Tax=Dermacentor silvarum TaxID=543639 RepID=UPI00189BF2C0|nr:kunitz-type serine protease inhibitor 6-like [Dermacentor silvarum]